MTTTDDGSARDSDVEAKVSALVARLAKLEPGFGHEKDIYRELGMKSAAGLELLMALEDEFGVSLSDDDFAEARTVEKLVSLVLRAGKAA